MTNDFIKSPFTLGVGLEPKDPDYHYFECHCMCHRHPGVMHIMACCDNGWKKIKKVKPNED